jgi:hypothetical protein
VPEPVNGGFWNLPPSDRDAAYDAACDRYGVADFFDLDAETRGEVYDRVTRGEPV